MAIGEYAFRECTSLKRLTVNRNVTYFYNKAFAGNVTLEVVRINSTGDDILVSNENLLDETSNTLQFSVSTDNFTSFVGNYFWAPYASRFIVED